MNAITKTEAGALVVIQPGHDRTKYLGGSDAAAVMGLSPWATPVELWMKKTGREVEIITPEQQRRFDRGTKLEPFIKDMVVQRLRDEGMEVEVIATNVRYRDSEMPFLAAEIDFELLLSGVMEIGGREVVFDRTHVNADAKSVTGFARKKWGTESTEDVPIEYAAQFMHGLGVTGRSACLVAALRSFDDVDIYWTLRDDETIAAMRSRMAEFWNEHVLKDVPPDPMNFSDIKELFPTDNGQAIEATPEIAGKVQDYRRIKATIKDLEDQEEALKFEIGDYISPHSILKFGGLEVASWKAQGRSDFEEKRFREDHPELAAQYTKRSTTRVLRLKKAK